MLETLKNIGQLENVFDETNNFRQQLEDIFRLNPDYLLINKRLSEMSSWVAIANTTNDFSIKFKLFYAISNLTTEIIEKHQNFIPIPIRDELVIFADSAMAIGKINQAVQTILEGGKTNSDGNLLVGIEKLSTAIIIIADVVDHYWSNLSNEIHESLKKTVQAFVEIESKTEFKGSGNRIQFNANKQVLQYTASYILWKIEKFEKEEKGAESEKDSNNVKQLRPFGLCTGEFVVADDFNEPLPEEILNQFEGE
jgi:hypothetical protein